jgi:MoxR-like ATPase
LGYPSTEDELSLLERKKGRNLLDLVDPILTCRELEQIREEVDKIHIHRDIIDYIVKIIDQTRRHPDLLLGASPRASLALAAMAKAAAYSQGRDFVIPKDIHPIITETLAHRLILRPGAESENITSTKILHNILMATTAPRVG